MMNISFLPNAESAKFTLIPGKILCIGRNYAAHAKELNNKVPTEPMIFLKPSSSLIGNGEAIIIPNQSQNVHHEAELVVVIGKKGKNIDEKDALNHVAGYACGLDMTARDLQSIAKEKRHPWSVAKGFDTFCPLGEITPADQIADPQNLQVTLTVNDEVRQDGNTSDMIFSVAHLIAFCSTIFTLMPGDLIYTGTPEGVGQVVAGDRLKLEITGLPALENVVVAN